MGDTDDWALKLGIDKIRVKQIHQTLVNDGILIERKRPTFYQIALEKLIETEEDGTMR